MGIDHRHLLRRDVVSSDGEKLGHVADVYVDVHDGSPKWLVVQGGLLSGAVSFVPTRGCREDRDGGLVLAFTRRQVRRAPHPPADGDLTVAEEARLAQHYAAADGQELPPLAVDDGSSSDAWLADPTTTSDDSVVRAEEEVEVGRSPRPRQRARLVKRVVTEDVTFTVPLRREVLRLEYEDIGEEEAEDVAATDGRAPFSPVEDHEVVLYAEVVEYAKKVVPKERVRLQQQVVPDEVDLRTEVRKEQVDLADAPAG